MNVIDSDMDIYRYKTKIGYWADVRLRRWPRADFHYLGTITIPLKFERPHTFAWGWDENGRSIDREDRGFDLIDFRPGADRHEPQSYFYWLGKEAA